MANNLRFIRNIIYRMKRDYGFDANFVWRTGETYDLENSSSTVTYDSHMVKRVIVFPETERRDFVYDLTFIASNKNFTYGGHFDAKKRRIILDFRDKPSQLEIDDFVIITGTHYAIKTIQRFDDFQSYIISIEQISNIPLQNNIKQAYYQHLNLTHTAVAVIV